MRLLALAAALSLAVPAAGQRLPHRLRPADLDTPAALQRVAHELFHPARGTVLELKLEGRRLEHALGCEIETWQAATEEAVPLGSFVRFRAWPLPESSVDLALRLEDGLVKGVAAVRPAILSGAGFPLLPAAIAKMGDVPLAVWAPAAARLFGALTYVEAALAGPATGEPADEKAAAAAVGAIEAMRPPLLPGASFPAVELPDEAGAKFDVKRLGASSALVIVASVKHDVSRELIARVSRYVQENPGRFAVVWVLADRPRAIAAFRARGGKLDGIVLPDPDRKLRDALRVTVLPSVYAFDSKKLVGHMRAVAREYDELSDAFDDFPIFGKAPPRAVALAVAGAPAAIALLPELEKGALEAAARKLLGGADVSVTPDRTVARWTDGWCVQRLEVLDARGNVIGTLARLVIALDARSRLDLALRLERGAVAGVEPLAPIRIGDQDVPGLAALVTAVAHRPPEGSGAALARTLDGLAAAGRPARPATAARLELRLGTPALPPGQALPELAGPDPEGRLIGPGSWKARPALILVSDRAVPAELVPTARAAAPARPIVAILTATTPAEARALIPAQPDVHVILDPDGQLAARLRPPSMPYLYAVDARGAITGRTAWAGKASLEAVR